MVLAGEGLPDIVFESGGRATIGGSTEMRERLSKHAPRASGVERCGGTEAAARLTELVARIVQRDQAALAGLYRETVSRVFAVALRVVRTHEGAEEVVEDTFIQVWNTAHSYDSSRGGVLGWLLTIARSRALDHLRRLEPFEVSAAPEDLEDEPDGGITDPYDLLALTEARSAVHRALAQLSPVERQLIGLAFLRGLTHQEIASATRIPLGSVKTFIRRGLTNLRELLADPAQHP
jgi:RNA polymerase sigma-70 factor (ECF subfamily)